MDKCYPVIVIIIITTTVASIIIILLQRKKKKEELLWEVCSKMSMIKDLFWRTIKKLSSKKLILKVLFQITHFEMHFMYSESLISKNHI